LCKWQKNVPGDWVSGSGTGADISGALRAAAWVDGGVNDICPAGFSVPTEEELITLATTIVLSFILLSRSIQASALRFILWLSLKALLAIA
jgi:hypothetical protein